MSDENKALVRRWFEEVWNRGRAEAIDEMLTPDCPAHGMTDEMGNTLRGPDAFKTFHRTFRTALPDMTITVEDLIAEGDMVVARYSVRATHRGDSLGIAATGKPVEITGITISRIENGKIAEGWNNFDLMGLFQQVGAR